MQADVSANSHCNADTACDAVADRLAVRPSVSGDDLAILIFMIECESRFNSPSSLPGQGKENPEKRRRLMMLEHHNPTHIDSITQLMAMVQYSDWQAVGLSWNP